MKFNLEKLSDQELIQLNRRIIEIMNLRRRNQTTRELLKFYVGEHVEFKNDFGELIRGVIVRVNQKTISVQTHQPCSQWRLSPQLVSKIKATPKLVSGSDQGIVIDLFNKA